MKHSKNSLSDILTLSPMLRDIVHKVEQLSKLNKAVLKKLDPQLATHCRVANIRDGILILTTLSPTWGHQLRFASSDLLSALRAEPEWCGLKSIKIHVRPNEINVPEPKATINAPKPQLSSLNASHLYKIAENITFSRLQESLIKLAKNCFTPLEGGRER